MLLPIITYIITVIMKHNTHKEAVRDLNYLFDGVINAKKPSMKSLEEIQAKLYWHRKNAIKVPDFFYKIFKSKQQDADHKFAELQ